MLELFDIACVEGCVYFWHVISLAIIVRANGGRWGLCAVCKRVPRGGFVSSGYFLPRVDFVWLVLPLALLVVLAACLIARVGSGLASDGGCATPVSLRVFVF